MTSSIDPAEFCTIDTRRIQSFAASAGSPIVAGAGSDGRVHVWDVIGREKLVEVPTTKDSGGLSLALSDDGGSCFIGSYYAWGLACFDPVNRTERWRRTDVKRVQGLSFVAADQSVVAWFEGRAGLTFDGRTGETVARHVGLRAIHASRFDRARLEYGRQVDVYGPDDVRHRLPAESFALLTAAFSSEFCLVSESTAAVRAISLDSGLLKWTYRPRPGAHVLEIEYAPRLGVFVALEYAYSGEARTTGPMVALLHLDTGGHVTFRRSIREWSTAVFCADGELLLNGLGELHDVKTGDVIHVFEFPR